MKRAWYIVLLCALALALAGTASAQTQVGTVLGKVVDQSGGVLPGASVTLVGPRGSVTVVTDSLGEFRFVGVQPATYVLKLELQGFIAQEKDAVIVGMGKSVIAEFSLKVGGVSESIDVVGSTSIVDVKSSATESTISSQLLNSVPIYSSTSTELLNAAPGINSSSAYGGQGSYGNALLLDGVDTRDPDGGSAWTFFNQNLIDEIQIGGLGAPAEYGGFSGGVVNTITKSGSNRFAGLFSIRYTADWLASNNISQTILGQNPSLGSADVTKKLMDYTVQLGGPLKKDKAFFFASIQRYSDNMDPSGPNNKSTDISPRFNFKLTLQPTTSDTITASVQYDQYNVTGRTGYWPASQTTYDQTVTEDAPEWVWNVQWRKIFGSKTLLETKLTGYWGYYYLDPVDPAPYSYDAATDTYCCGGGGGLYYADRTRNQINVAVTQYAEKFGHHQFKFGFEIERSHVRSQYQPYGPAGFYTYLYGGIPYYRVSYGYDQTMNNRRTSLYAQDQWSVNRLTLNLGLRMDHIVGNVPALNKNVYTPAPAWGPRIGVAYDVTGKGTTVLKGFFGQYFEGTATAFFARAAPGKQPVLALPLDPETGQPTGDPAEVWVPALPYAVSSNIKHPRTTEYNVAWEQQLAGTLHFTVTGIWRHTDNFVNSVVPGAEWKPVTLTNDLTGQTFTGYQWANRSSTINNFTIQNPIGYQYLSDTGAVIATLDPTRKYRALMLSLSRPLKNRWSFQGSYVLAKAEGNVDNSGYSTWLGGTQFDSPNTGIINAYGELTNSRRHEIKMYGSYQIPKAEVVLSLVYTGTSGRPFTAYERYCNSGDNCPSNGLNLPSPSSRRNIFIEPRGSRVNDFYNELDLRVEKVFQYAGNRFGVYADVMNVFNTATILSREAQYPSSGGIAFLAPLTVQGARQVSFGARWSF